MTLPKVRFGYGNFGLGDDGPSTFDPAQPNLPPGGSPPPVLGDLGLTFQPSGSTQSGSGGATNSAGPSTSPSAAGGGGFVININWDSSVSNAPAAFKTDVMAAVQYLESQFTNSVTITIDVGYGEINGQALSSNALGESEATNYVSESYSSVRSALL